MSVKTEHPLIDRFWNPKRWTEFGVGEGKGGWSSNLLLFFTTNCLSSNHEDDFTVEMTETGLVYDDIVL